MSSPRSAALRSAVPGVALDGALKPDGDLSAQVGGLEALGLAEVEHNARNNRMRAR